MPSLIDLIDILYSFTSGSCDSVFVRFDFRKIFTDRTRERGLNRSRNPDVTVLHAQCTMYELLDARGI